MSVALRCVCVNSWWSAEHSQGPSWFLWSQWYVSLLAAVLSGWGEGLFWFFWGGGQWEGGGKVADFFIYFTLSFKNNPFPLSLRIFQFCCCCCCVETLASKLHVKMLLPLLLFFSFYKFKQKFSILSLCLSMIFWGKFQLHVSPISEKKG